jgi:hypothetical protein
MTVLYYVGERISARNLLKKMLVKLTPGVSLPTQMQSNYITFSFNKKSLIDLNPAYNKPVLRNYSLNQKKNYEETGTVIQTCFQTFFV